MKKKILVLTIFAVWVLLPTSIFAVTRYKINSGDTITIKRIPTDEKVVEDVVDLGVVAPSAIVAATQITATVAAAQNMNLVEYLRFFFSFFIAKRGPRRDFWGLIYDSKDSSPIAFAVIRIFSGTDNKLIKTTVSDLDGRYGFVLDPGKYKLEVGHQDYSFPVKDRMAIALQNDNHIYTGGELLIKEAMSIDFNIPMEGKEVKRAFSFRKLRKIWLNSGLIKLTQNMYFIYALLVLNCLMLLSRFNILFLLNAIYYGIFVIIHLVAYFRKPARTWGNVLDSKSNKPIPYAFVKIFNKNTGALIDSKITDLNGRFQFYPKQGEYSAVVQAKGFKLPGDLKTVDFVVNKKSIQFDIKMDESKEIGLDKFGYISTPL